MGDAGRTGRKIIIDTYGGMPERWRGLLGQGPPKVDRSGRIRKARVAKNVVAAGLDDR